MIFFNSNKNGLSLFDIRTAYIVAGALVLAALSYILMTGLSMFIKKERYRGLRLTTKNIAYIAMLSTVSVVTTVVIALYMPAAVLPPIRIAIEGLMIKITGYIFGPVIGILCALITDILVMMFVPSYIHPAYIVTVIGFGFISGIAGDLRRMFHQKSWILILITNIFIIGFGTTALVMTYYAPQFADFAVDEVPFTKNVPIKKWIMMLIISIGTVLILVVVWATWMYFRFIKKDTKGFNDLVPIILLAVINEYIVTVLIASWGDVSLLTNRTEDYGLAMIPRLAMAPIKIFFNTVIIYITWKTIRPLINEDR